MHVKTLIDTYAALFRNTKVDGAILEIGCGPAPATLLTHKAFSGAKYRVGINLRAYKNYDFDVLAGNSNDMRDLFEDESFDVVISNMVLEHDQFFWKSLEEIRRVLKPGGAFVAGVPCLARRLKHCLHVSPIERKRITGVVNSTDTWRVHAAPNDYWRFTEEAYKTVIMHGFSSITYSIIFMPPLLIGMGIKDA